MHGRNKADFGRLTAAMRSVAPETVAVALTNGPNDAQYRTAKLQPAGFRLRLIGLRHDAPHWPQNRIAGLQPSYRRLCAPHGHRGSIQVMDRLNNYVAPVPISRNFGAPDSALKTNYNPRVGFNWPHAFNNHWTLIQRFDTDFRDLNIVAVILCSRTAPLHFAKYQDLSIPSRRKNARLLHEPRFNGTFRYQWARGDYRRLRDDDGDDDGENCCRSNRL
jgi:hypothetical protein